MSRAALRRRVFAVVGIYLAWAVLGIATFLMDNMSSEDARTLLAPGGHFHHYRYFELFRELSPAVLLLATAWLVFCFQRRVSFLNNLRVFWPPLVESVQRAIEYLRRAEGDIEEFERTLTALRSRMDDSRILFRWKKRSRKADGRHPCEGITHIHKMFQGFGFHERMPEEEQRQVHDTILNIWHRVRGQILKEFDQANVD